MCKKEIAITLRYIGKTVTCQRVGIKFDRISEASRLSKISRSPVV